MLLRKPRPVESVQDDQAATARVYMNALSVIAAYPFAYPLHAFRYFLLAMVASVISQPLHAQERLDQAEVAQIVDAVIERWIPAGKRLSRVPVEQRGVFFDHDRTWAAFGHAGAAEFPLSALRLRTTVRPGSQDLLNGCGAPSRCSTQLGWGVYVSIAPSSVTTSEAVIRASFFWPDLGNTPFEQGVAPEGRASLVGFNAQLYFVRSPDGTWRFVKEGPTLVFE